MLVSALVGIQCGLDLPPDLNFALMSVCFAAHDLVYEDFDLVLIVEFAQGNAQGPVLAFAMCTVEVLGCTGTYTLQHSALSLSSDPNVVALWDTQLIDDMIAIATLLAGLCRLLHHVRIITSLKDPVKWWVNPLGCLRSYRPER